MGILGRLERRGDELRWEEGTACGLKALGAVTLVSGAAMGLAAALVASREEGAGVLGGLGLGALSVLSLLFAPVLLFGRSAISVDRRRVRRAFRVLFTVWSQETPVAGSRAVVVQREAFLQRRHPGIGYRPVVTVRLGLDTPSGFAPVVAALEGPDTERELGPSVGALQQLLGLPWEDRRVDASQLLAEKRQEMLKRRLVVLAVTGALSLVLVLVVAAAVVLSEGRPAPASPGWQAPAGGAPEGPSPRRRRR